jgi:hypothetical protein
LGFAVCPDPERCCVAHPEPERYGLGLCLGVGLGEPFRGEPYAERDRHRPERVIAEGLGEPGEVAARVSCWRGRS